ncbi:MAG: response regulator [Candidatus Rokubacteria bacterium]|nr:response regulator [Candidatus Rokubacteria bacterium]
MARALREPQTIMHALAVRPVARVLVVDDEAEVRQAIAELLMEEGHEVTVAADAAEALSRLRTGLAPDVVLTDLRMPGMSGWELVTAIKARYPGVRVGLITGCLAQLPPTPSQQAAVDFVLEKPVDFQSLLGWL